MVHNGGRAQGNLYAPQPFYDYWALNNLDMAGALIGMNATEDWRLLFDDYELPTRIPTGTGARWQAAIYLYGDVGFVWVLDWPGVNTCNLGGSFLTLTLSSSNRKEYTINTEKLFPSAAQFEISSMTSGFGKPRLYPKIYESLINGSGATSKFDPRFLARQSGMGATRTMDWSETNRTRLINWSDRKVEGCFSYQSERRKVAWWCGAATRSKNRLTTATTFPTLIHGQPVQFRAPDKPIILTVASVSKGNPTTLNFTGNHGLSNGDKIACNVSEHGGGSWLSVMNAISASTGMPPDYAATVTDADSITIPLNSTGFADPSGTFSVMPALELSDGVTTKRCLKQYVSNYFATTEFNLWADTEDVTAVYDANFDIFLLSGNDPEFIGGVPYELHIELCNYLGSHPQVCVPYLATTSFVTSMATLFKSSVASGLVTDFERGNEIWNFATGFYMTSYAAANAARLYGSLDYNLDYARAVNETSDTIAAVYGPSGTNDWNMVGSGWAIQWLFSTNRLRGNAAINGGSSAGYPANKIDKWHIAFYVTPPFSGQSNANTYSGYSTALANYLLGGASKEAAFDWMLQEHLDPTDASYIATYGLGQPLSYWVESAVPGWLTTLSTYTGRRGTGIVFGAYEGHPSGSAGANALDGGFSAGDITTVRAFWPAYLRSTQAATGMTRYLQDLTDAGVHLISQYAMATTWGDGATWGAQEMNDIDGPATPQFSALKAWNAPPVITGSFGLQF